jgi:Ca2+/H+ antiporter, TMEM165/GDT1 family
VGETFSLTLDPGVGLEARCGVIFVAELGEKSQLMALAFATRHRAFAVLIGITAATAVVHAVSVLIGAPLGAALPRGPVNLLAAFAFLAFAASTPRGDSLSEDEADRARRSTGSAVLATREGPLGTWAGSTPGMVAADAIDILIGQQLGRRLPERAVRIGAAASFVVFGVLLVVEAVRGWGEAAACRPGAPRQR